MRKFIGFRLRHKKDQDIIEALKGIEEGEVSELVRKGLRLMLNTNKCHQATSEQHLQNKQSTVKQEPVKQKTATKVTVWNFPK